MTIIEKQSVKTLKIAVNILNSGGVVVCPTDTVYGFLALAENPPSYKATEGQSKKAVEKIFKIKKRPKNKPLPIFVRDLKMAHELAEISPDQEKVLKKYWPGKFTFILKLRSPSLRGTAVTKQSRIAIRIPKYKFLNDLLKKVNKPLAQTSVNISGQEPINKISDIINLPEIAFWVDLIIDAGNLKKRKSSVIIDLTNSKIKILRK